MQPIKQQHQQQKQFVLYYFTVDDSDSDSSFRDDSLRDDSHRDDSLSPSESSAFTSVRPETPTSTSSSCCTALCDVKCRLETKDLWAKFHELGTEMIITKTGRLVL